MTIQLSLILWTAICFVVLYFILRKWLFEPLLALMDQRQQKIDRARQQIHEAQQRREQQQAEALAEAEARLRRAQDEAKAETEQVRLEGKRLLEEAKKEHIATVESCRAAMAADSENDIRTAAPTVSILADRFLSRLFTDLT